MINDRISVLIDSLGITPNKFSERINVSPTVIHNIIKARRSKPSYEILEKILFTFIEVNSDWLIRGEGSIWRKKAKILRGNQTTSESVEARVIGLIDAIRETSLAEYEIFELGELVELLINENHAQKNKMVKLHERQEEIIKTLMRLKVKL